MDRVAQHCEAVILRRHYAPCRRCASPWFALCVSLELQNAGLACKWDAALDVGCGYFTAFCVDCPQAYRILTP